MKCLTCGKIIENNKGLTSGKNHFCGNECKKIYNYYLLEDKVLKYCNTPNNNCAICPINQECSIFLEIEKQIETDEDILNYTIPEINGK